MILVNIDYIPGKEFDVIGVVKGSTIRSTNMFKDISAGLKSIVGGEVVNYTQMMSESRQIATKRMVDEAESLGADAVINIRYATSSIMQGASEMMVYGTAVKIR